MACWVAAEIPGPGPGAFRAGKRNGGAGGDDVLGSCQAIVALSICGMTFRWSSTSCLGVESALRLLR